MPAASARAAAASCWRSAAGPAAGGTAARDEGWEAALLRVVRSAGVKGDDGPPRRQTLTTLLPAVGPRVASVLDAAGDDPWLGPVVAMARHDLGIGPEPSTRQLLWLVVDDLSTDPDDPDDFEDDVHDSPLEALLAEPGAVTTALALDHPAAREVLRAAAPHLADANLARALRKALAGRSGNPALRVGAARPGRGDGPRGRRGRQ